jgi:SAM-dependent methyltransferase
MTVPAAIPLPPFELRYRVGPTEPADYDNPDGNPILDHFGVPHDAYEAVFDFGCGCGRQARQLMQQRTAKPARYLGIDPQRSLIAWCEQNLAPIDNRYRFRHTDVYSPWYAPENSLRLAEPFPAGDSSFSLIIATSVFTHLAKDQAEFYLSEVARILTPNGVAYTTWLFFDRASFSFADVHCLYTSHVDFGQAVLFDREWFLATARRMGLAVRLTVPPEIPGLQWVVLLVKRQPDSVDRFPLGMEGAEWVCGATLKPMATTTPPSELAAKHKKTHALVVPQDKPGLPPLFGALAELDTMKRSRAWAIGRAVTSPVRWLKKFF